MAQELPVDLNGYWKIETETDTSVVECKMYRLPKRKVKKLLMKDSVLMKFILDQGEITEMAMRKGVYYLVYVQSNNTMSMYSAYGEMLVSGEFYKGANQYGIKSDELDFKMLPISKTEFDRLKERVIQPVGDRNVPDNEVDTN
jgi:hypothetical protein